MTTALDAWCTDVEIIGIESDCIESLHLTAFFAFLFRHAQTNWHKIQTLMIYRGMFGFSFWHNFYTEVKFSSVFFVTCWNFEC